MQAGKGAGYERWAKVYNLKQMAAALQYLQENNLLSYDELAAKAATASEHFHTLSEQIQQLESGMQQNAALKVSIWQELSTKKKTAYKEYRAARSTMREVLTVKANIDALLGDTQWERNKEQER